VKEFGKDLGAKTALKRRYIGKLVEKHWRFKSRIWFIKMFTMMKMKHI
jgi:hypothetical protein